MAREQEWRLLEGSPHLPEGSRSFTVGRGDHYHVAVTLKGRCAANDATALRAKLHPSYAPGELVRSTEVTVRTMGSTLTIAGYLPKGYSFKHPDPGVIEFTVPVYAHGVSWKVGVAGSPSWLTEWFLNGPHDSPWRRASERSFETHHTRGWGTPANHPSDFIGSKSGGTGIDHFLVRVAGVDAVVHAVPKGLAPEWSYSIGISYYGVIPDETVRRGLEELLGFVFGRRLMKVASVAYDAAGFAAEAEIVNPWGTDVQGPCGRPDWSIIPLSFAQGGSANVEEVIATLLPPYLALREKLRLDDVLWRMSVGSEAATTIDIPIFAAGLEILSSAWFNASESRSKGTYLPKSDFDALLVGELSALAGKLKEQKYGDRILRKMQRAYETSGNERLRWFFDEIGLPIGAVEEKALRSRNHAVHPTKSHTSEEVREFVRMANVYRSVMVRTVLKLLSWTGPYKDYGALNHPLHRLDEPSGEEGT